MLNVCRRFNSPLAAEPAPSCAQVMPPSGSGRARPADYLSARPVPASHVNRHLCVAGQADKGSAVAVLEIVLANEPAGVLASS